MQWKPDGLWGAPLNSMKGPDLGCTAASLPQPEGSRSASTACTSPVLARSHTVQPWHASPVMLSQERFKGLSLPRNPTVPFQVFFSARVLEKSTFLLPYLNRKIIHPLCKPQNSKSTEPFCYCYFSETKLYILPIPTQDHLCSFRLANYCFPITRRPVRILQRAPEASRMKGVNSELADR